MKPVKQPHSFDLTGQDVDSLPVVQGDMNGREVLLSRWRMTWPERIRALLAGDVWLLVHSLSHPPVSVMVDNPYVDERRHYGWRGALESRGVRWHWQNLNEHRNGQVRGSGLRHGRAWLYTNGPTFHTEWVLGKLGLALSVELESYGDDDVLLHGAVPGVSVFLGGRKVIPQSWLPREPKELRVSCHSGKLWWNVWTPVHSWSSRTPKWRDGNFDPTDFLLGRPQYSTRELSTHRAEIPMPEGVYPATVVLSEATWKRARWPWPKRLLRAEITPDQGVPHPGKGENSYDIDEDATYSMTTQASSVSEAVGKFVASVLRDRERHGGANWRPEVRQPA